MFLPINQNDLKSLGWSELDIIFVLGDAYIDSPYCGVAILGKLLISRGYKVGVISQPSLDTPDDILSLGVPKLFWGVSAGAVDSMVSNYTSLMKRRREDDLTPGGVNNRRPDRATIKYTNLIKQFDKFKRKIVIGGVEASLRRVAHYDYWDDKIRRSILFDSKADILIYGMGELSILELAERLARDDDYSNILGICYISKNLKGGYIELPSYEEVSASKSKFSEMFQIFYENSDPVTAKGLLQRHGDRILIHNPPQRVLEQRELDAIYEMEFEHDIHPEIKKLGKVKALDTVKFSLTINRGCFGECNFCSIAVHQGTRVVSRSKESIIRELHFISKLKHFDGVIRDLGGPTANMYMFECDKKIKYGKCKDKRCLTPQICSNMSVDHSNLIDLYRAVRKIPSIKKIFVSSGVRTDLILKDSKSGEKYLEELIKYHVSGQLKIAPEHTDKDVLRLMGKPSNFDLSEFIDKFYSISRKNSLKYFLTYYFIAGHPGCSQNNMENLNKYIQKHIKTPPEQVQIFTPLPSTYSALMYYTGIDIDTGGSIFVERALKMKRAQKELIIKN